jgi:hypothetical protein
MAGRYGANRLIWAFVHSVPGLNLKPAPGSLSQFMIVLQARILPVGATMENIQVREMVEVIAKALSDRPEEIHVTEIAGQQISVIELRAAKEDLGACPRINNNMIVM